MMDGESFISHLKSLGVPGVESLVGSDYDWHFYENSPLTTFFAWFSENITQSDVLTEEELMEYDAAVAKGDTLTNHQLEDMEACFSELPTSHNSDSGEKHYDEYSPEEQQRLESQLEILSMRKNQLSSHKMELREDVYNASENIKLDVANFKGHVETVHNLSQNLTTAHTELSSSLDKILDMFISFEKSPEGEVKFLSQVDLTEWRQEEAKFTEILKAYITKQFREGVEKVAGVDDSNEYCLLDADNLDLHLVRGAGKAEYIQNVTELNRLDKVLRQTEERRLDALLLQARRRAEVEEANRLLASIHRGQFSTALPLINQQIRDAEESRIMVESERKRQHQVLQSLVSEVAQLESSRTISGNYQLKCKRQEYFMEKQKIVMDLLISQLSRHDWIKLALEIESDQIGDILQVLQTINSMISDKDKSYKQRMVRLESLQQDFNKERGTGQLPHCLATLSQILPQVPNPSPLGREPHREEPLTGETLMKQINCFNKALMVAKEQISTARHPQFSRLSGMAKNCELLEIALFGNVGSHRSLPFTWLDPKLAERCANAEQEDWTLKQKFLQILGQYEEKKKTLQIEPTLQKELMQWTTEVMKFQS